VQTAYQDDFPDLQGINTRYTRLNDTNKTLTARHESSGGEMDNIISNMEQYKKDAGHESLSYTNKIAEEQAVL